MTSVNQETWKLLHSDTAVQKDLSRKLINMRALAKYLIKKHDLKTSLDSVISSIRRYQSDETFMEEETALLHIFKNARIGTTNSVTVLSTTVPANEFQGRMCKASGHTHNGVKLVTGSDGVRLIIDQRELEAVKTLFKKEEIRDVANDISEISVMVKEDAAHTKGVIARLTSELAMSNINIQELIVAMPEILVYVKHKDLVKAHDSLLKLSRNA